MTGASAAQVGALVSAASPYLKPILITAGGILAALGIIVATFPLLARITGPEVARNE